MNRIIIDRIEKSDKAMDIFNYFKPVFDELDTFYQALLLRTGGVINEQGIISALKRITRVFWR